MKRRVLDPAARKVVPIAEAVEKRRKKVARENLHGLAFALEGRDEDPDAATDFTLLGNMAMLEGAFEEAIEAFSRSLSLAPDDVGARAGRGRSLAAMGEHALALVDYDHAAALAPDQARHHLGRASALGGLGRMEEALAATSRALEVAPDSAGAYYARAVYRSHVDETDVGVRADLDRAVELAPHERVYLEKRADSLLESEEYDLALADFDRALVLAPGEARLHYQRGKCLNELAWVSGSVRAPAGAQDVGAQLRREAALASLERALELAPEEGDLRGDILWALVQVREAMPDEEALFATIDRALAVLPEDDGRLLLSLRGDRLRRRSGSPAEP